ncbi:MAG: nucleoside/nucleotide kinase family protein [Butyrivibrio sp.]|nr:nucleoside/nucleotide kinase family protein [Butyrivibrio sp.]
MRYQVNINGIDVDANYSDEVIKTYVEPLLERFEEMRRTKGRRILVMLAAPPGAGKSTFVSFLEHYAKSFYKDITLQAIGMDGFHRRQEYLLSHETDVDGVMMPMVKIKGAPITFDLESLTEKIRQVKEGENCGWPAYDRHLHNPIEDAVWVTGDIIVLEGNYLLLDADGWKDLHKMADYTLFITAKEDMLRERLVSRKAASGNTLEKAAEFVDFSDMKNVRLCLNHSLKPDMELMLF